jgi:hypothetical protein
MLIDEDLQICKKLQLSFQFSPFISWAVIVLTLHTTIAIIISTATTTLRNIFVKLN